MPVEVDVGQRAVAVTTEIGRPSVELLQPAGKGGIDATVKPRAVGHEQRWAVAAEVVQGEGDRVGGGDAVQHSRGGWNAGGELVGRLQSRHQLSDRRWPHSEILIHPHIGHGAALVDDDSRRVRDLAALLVEYAVRLHRREVRIHQQREGQTRLLSKGLQLVRRIGADQPELGAGVVDGAEVLLQLN